MHPTEPAKVLVDPPEGTIESTALGGYGEIVVFVDDPSLGAVPQPTWPTDCANAPSPAPLGAMDPAGFTGTLDGVDWYGDQTVTYGDPMWTQEGVQLRMTWTATDPRISGDVEYESDWHVFPRAYLSLEAATIAVTNPDGRRTGTGTGLQMDSEQGTPFTAVLTGEGAYAGLTAYVVFDMMSSQLQGAVFPGPMPEAPPAR